MNIFELRHTKAGMTLIEMVISLAILSVLMTSTMGMIISSNNIFISTSKATLDKQVGNSVYDLLESILKYTTHLEISDEYNTSMDQCFSVGDTVTTEGVGESGKLYYKSDTAQDESGNAVLLYPESFYGTGTQARTIQYEVNKVGNDGKHAEIVVRVIREGEIVYTRSAVVRCVNLALVGGANGNSLTTTEDAPTLNPVLSFSVDENLISGGSTAWNIEYKVADYLAQYNKIVKDYHDAFAAANKALNNFYDTTAVVKKSVLLRYINNRNIAVYGSSADDVGTPKYTTNINADTGKISSLATYDSTKAYTEWNNIRAVFQQRMYNLLNFMPTTVTNVEDPYYGILASREELFAGFLLTYYSVNGEHKQVTQASWPTFDNPETFFSKTTMEDFATGSGTYDGDTMVILGYFKDNVDNTFYASSSDSYTVFQSPTEVEMTCTESGYADKYSGTKIMSNSNFTYNYSGNSGAVSGEKYTVADGTNYVNSNDTLCFSIVAPTTVSTRALDTWNGAGSSTCYATEIYERTGWYLGKKYETKSYIKMGYTEYKYYNYTVTAPASNKITLSSAVVDDYDFTYDPQNTTVYVMTDKGDYSYRYGKISQTITGGFKNGVYTYSNNAWAYKSASVDRTTWQTAVNTLISAEYLNAKNISDYCDLVTWTPVSISGESSQSSVFNFTPKSSIEGDGLTEGWYYYNEGNQAYHFFYIKAMATSAEYSDDDSGSEESKKTYKVNENKIAVAKQSADAGVDSAGFVRITSCDYQCYHVTYAQAQYEATTVAANTKNTQKLKFIIYHGNESYHQYTDWFLYSVDWNSWFTSNAETKGILNRILNRAGKLVDTIKVFFGGESTYTTVSSITGSNAKDSLGAQVRYDVDAVGTTHSYELAWVVYNADTGTWYYLPATSTRVSGWLSSSSVSSVEDEPVALDLTSYQSSASLYTNILNRQRTYPVVDGTVIQYYATEDAVWVSLPITEKAA